MLKIGSLGLSSLDLWTLVGKTRKPSNSVLKYPGVSAAPNSPEELRPFRGPTRKWTGKWRRFPGRQFPDQAIQMRKGSRAGAILTFSREPTRELNMNPTDDSKCQTTPTFRGLRHPLSRPSEDNPYSMFDQPGVAPSSLETEPLPRELQP